MKTCFCCNTTKSIGDFYKHPKSSDGYLNKCKSCCKIQAAKNYHLKTNDEIWVKKEKERTRERYHRLSYRGKYMPTAEQKLEIMKKYFGNYPEKRYAHGACKSPAINGYERHHWSYNKAHVSDIIYLTNSDHNLLHTLVQYDQSIKMYRKDGVILDSKRSHIEILENNEIHYLLESNSLSIN